MLRERVRLDGDVELQLERGGAGSHTVVVPNATYLREPFSWLAEEGAVAYYDLRNRGHSSPVDEPELLLGGIDLDVSDLEDVRRWLGLERMTLIGHSYLGLMVALYAARYAHRVERMVLIGAVPPDVGKTQPEDRRATPRDDVPRSEDVTALEALREDPGAESEAFARAWWRVTAQLMVGDPSETVMDYEPYLAIPNEWPARQERHIGENIWPSIGRLGSTDRDFGRVQAPALVIHGTEDRAVAFGAGYDWVELLPRASLHLVPGAGHLPWLEDAEGLRTAVASFLRGEAP